MRKAIHQSRILITTTTPLTSFSRKLIRIFFILAVFQITANGLFAQDNNSLIEITGQVNGQEKKEPLSDVSVQVKGTIAGTVTNKEGFFKLRTRTNFLLR